MLESLKERVCEANLALARSGLVTLTWGNVSGFDPSSGLTVIKPSGIDYDHLSPTDMVVVDLEGRRVEGALSPSSDTPTHLRIYASFAGVTGMVHTHSPYATAFAQAGRELPCYGTSHADHFAGTVPLVRALLPAQVTSDYEGETGAAIVDRFDSLDPLAIPAVLCQYHGPFTWGPSPEAALDNAIALEAVARMAATTLALQPHLAALPDYLLQKHYTRKHGPAATYGQAPTAD